jgi:hypothetical protein
MSVFLQPLQTVTVGAGGTSSVSFTNIPQTFTDLKIEYSISSTVASTNDSIVLAFNSSTSNFSNTYLYGNPPGGNAISGRGNYYGGLSDGSTATSNTFANNELYISNYAGSNYKSYIVDSVNENNATAAFQFLVAGLWSSTSAISSITFTTSLLISQYSKFSLYGVLRQGI